MPSFQPPHPKKTLHSTFTLKWLFLVSGYSSLCLRLATQRLMEREMKRGRDKEAAHVHASHMAGNGAWEHERGYPGRGGWRQRRIVSGNFEWRCSIDHFEAFMINVIFLSALQCPSTIAAEWHAGTRKVFSSRSSIWGN